MCANVTPGVDSQGETSCRLPTYLPGVRTTISMLSVLWS
jgi:hypothetical protein